MSVERTYCNKIGKFWLRGVDLHAPSGGYEPPVLSYATTALLQPSVRGWRCQRKNRSPQCRPQRSLELVGDGRIELPPHAPKAWMPAITPIPEFGRDGEIRTHAFLAPEARAFPLGHVPKLGGKPPSRTESSGFSGQRAHRLRQLPEFWWTRRHSKPRLTGANRLCSHLHHSPTWGDRRELNSRNRGHNPAHDPLCHGHHIKHLRLELPE